MKPCALVLLDEGNWNNVYGPEERAEAERWVQSPLPFQTAGSVQTTPEYLAEVEVLFGGWGMPKCDEAFLRGAPQLKAIFYAAGSVRGFVTDALWERGIRVSASNPALALAVAEFALGQVLLGLKGFFRMGRDVGKTHAHVRSPCPGIYGSTVGLVSVGAIARHLISLLQPFSVKIVAYDPFLSAEEARQLGVEPVSLEEVFIRSDVVSLHTPWLPETEGLIRGSHFRLMKPDAVFINTARGAVVDEAGLIEVFSERPDLFALLDVTWPEPPLPDSPLYGLSNIVITPHIAGPMGNECRRLGRMAIEECRRYLQGEPLRGEVTREMLARMA